MNEPVFGRPTRSYVAMSAPFGDVTDFVRHNVVGMEASPKSRPPC